MGGGRQEVIIFYKLSMVLLIKTKPKFTELIAIATKFARGTVLFFFFFFTNSLSHILNGLQSDSAHVLLLIRTETWVETAARGTYMT